MRLLYNKIMEICSKQQSQKFLYFISVIESIFFPMPPDLFMIPIQLAKRERAILIGLWVTLFSVAGGVIGYYIGYFFYDAIGVKIISFYGLQEKFFTFSNSISKSTEFWVVFTAGLTPIPYKLFTLGGGFFKFDILQFIIASLISRGLRFLFISFLIWKFGEYIKNFIERYLNILSILFALLLIGGFVAIKYFF